MRIDLDDLPPDPELLQRLVRDLVADKERRDGEIGKLRLIIKQLQRHQFGRHSEKLDSDQLALGCSLAVTVAAHDGRPCRP